MRILIFCDAFFPHLHVEKKAQTLLRAGHEVFLLAPSNGNALAEEYRGIKVIRARPRNSVEWLWDQIYFRISFVHPFWKKMLANIVEQEGIEALHIRNLPMVKTGLSIAKRFDIPLVADLVEDWPGGLKAGRVGLLRIMSLITPIWRWKRVEKFCARHANRVIATGEAAKEHFVRDCGISADKVSVVMNVMDWDYVCSLPIEENILKRYEPYFTILYVGGFSRIRGIETAISAMPRIGREIPNARLVLVGRNDSTAPFSEDCEKKLKNLARRLAVDSIVDFYGWQPSALIPSYVAASRVCLVPYLRSGNTDESSPNKLFEYMALGRPVIVSSCPSLQQIISEARAGLVYTAGDPDALAEAILDLYRDGELSLKLGQAGKDAAKTKYSWQASSKELVNIYAELC